MFSKYRKKVPGANKIHNICTDNRVQKDEHRVFKNSAGLTNSIFIIE